MSIEWKKQTFRFLKEVWQNNERKLDSGVEELSLGAEESSLGERYLDIMRILESDRICPPVLSSARRKFEEALSEVLSRLPEDDFCYVESTIGYVLEDPSVNMLAVNVPAPPSSPGHGKVGIDNIVFFCACLNLPPDAFIGLISHEIAHSFVRGGDYQTDEAMVDARAREWGFGHELDCLKQEQEKNRIANLTKSVRADRPD